MGDDIKTGRSMGSDNWAALHWSTENQNKWPQTTDLNQCNHLLLTQLRDKWSFWDPKYVQNY